MRSGLARYEREGVLNAEQVRLVFERARSDLAQTPRRLELSSDVLTEALRLMDQHRARPSRTLDVLHIATCLRYGTRGFVTNDKQQAQLARAAGLEVRWLEGGLEP